MENKPFPDLKALSEKLDQAAEKVEGQFVHPEIANNSLRFKKDKDIKGARYLAISLINGSEYIVNTNEEGFLRTSPWDIHPLIFYRINRPLKKEERLPLIELKDFYKLSTHSGYSIKVEKCLQFEKNEELISALQDQYDELQDLIKKFSLSFDKELLYQMESFIKANLQDKKFDQLKSKDFKLSDMKFKNKTLKKLPEAVKKKRIDMYLLFNNVFMDIMPLIVADDKEKLTKLGVHFNAVKGMILYSIKAKYIQQIIDNLSTGSSANIKIRRIKASRFLSEGGIDHTCEFSITG